jgi:hypothetical protein
MKEGNVMQANFKLLESSRYLVGENHSQWSLYVACYQNRSTYFYAVFDGDNRDEYIASANVSAATANSLECAIISTIQNPFGLEGLSDVFDRLRDGYYGSMFSMKEAS